MSFSRDEFKLLLQNSVTDISVGFRPPCWCPWEAPTWWRLHTKLSKFTYTISPNVAHMKNTAQTWILARVFVCLPYFISRILDFTGFDFYFRWRDSKNQQYISSLLIILDFIQNLFYFSGSVNKDEVFKLLCDLYAAFTVLCVC